MAEALKTIPGFEALMAEVAKRSTDANQNEDEEGDKDKEGDNNRTDDGKYVCVCYC